MVTAIPTMQRRPFVDTNGFEVIVKAEDSAEYFEVDWTHALATGETIATSTWDADGVSVSGEGTSGAKAFATVSKTNGDLTNTVTTSASRTFVRTVRFLDSGEAS